MLTLATRDHLGVPALDHATLERAFAEIEAPFALVDLDALWANARALAARAHSKPIRVATKSVRCRAVHERVLAAELGYGGLMTFTLAETLWLHDLGAGNLLLAYPTAAGAPWPPVRDAASATALAREVLRRPRLEPAGLMAYEGHIAGVGDRPPGKPLHGLAIRRMQRASAAELAGAGDQFATRCATASIFAGSPSQWASASTGWSRR